MKTNKVAQLIKRGALIATFIPAALFAQQDGGWAVDADGAWSNTANWNSALVADGASSTASFTNAITATRTVTLDAARTNGNLVFAGRAALNWVLTNSFQLTLSNALAVPTITVSSNTATINAFNAGGLAGAQGFIKTGPGVLSLAITNSPMALSGPVVLNQGQINVSTMNSGQLGTGTVTITNNAILSLYQANNGSTSASFTNSVIVPTGHTATLYNHQRGTFSSPLIGGGTLTFRVASNRGDVNGDWSGYTGQINVTGAAEFRLNYTGSSVNYGAAAIDLGAGVVLYNVGNYTATPQTFAIGALTGTGTLEGGTASATPSRWENFIIGSRNTDAQFDGTIIDAPSASGRPAGFTKVGTGSWTLSGKNSYSQATLIATGAVYGVTGGSISNSLITVATNIAFGGSTFGVKVTTAGGQWTGTNLVLRSGTKLEINFGTVVPSTVTPPLRSLGGITATSTVTLNILGGSGWVAGTAYPLAKYTSAYVGDGFGAFSLGTQPLRVSGVLSNDTVNSQIWYVVNAVNQPLHWAAGDGNWDIATTANWQDAVNASTTYQQQLGLGDAVLFNDSASGSSPIAVTLNTNVTPSGLTFSNVAKNYVLTGTSNILGAASLTKTGAGTLTLQNNNSFSGGTYFNGGTTVFSSLNNLGTGGINFGGGTLQFASGNTTDISTRTVWLGTGGGTIDTAGNNVTFANRIGNSGTGALTKTGSGSLTLTTNTTYTGNTTVSGGTLALGANGSLSNSPAIIVNGSGTLDVSAISGGINLNGLAAQILAGTGVVTGSVNLVTGSYITPATNNVVGTLSFTNDLNFNGGNCILDVGNSSRDLVAVGGALNLSSGTVTIKVIGGSLAAGAYKLFTYGSISGDPAVNLTLAFTQPGYSGVLSNDYSSLAVYLTVTALAVSDLVWQGDGTFNYWDTGSTADWTNSLGAAQVFSLGDNVLFNDTGSTNPPVNILSAVQPGSVRVNASESYTITGQKITGGTSITKSGSGTFVLANANNDITGPTTVNAGVLQVGDGSTYGTGLGVGGGVITNKAALVFNQPDSYTVNSDLTGSGTLTKAGGGALTLLGNNNVTNTISIDTGTLQIGAGGSLGTMPSGTIAMANNATLDINRSGTLAIGGGISGLGQVKLDGPATVNYSGANTYLNNTYINNGTLKLAAANAIPSGGSTTGWLVLDGAVTAAGTLDLNGFNQSVNALAGVTGTVKGQILNNSGSGTSWLTVHAIADTDYYGLILDNSTGSGKVGLVKNGANTLNLRGANNFSGGVTNYQGDLGFASAAAIGSGPITLMGGSISALASGGTVDLSARTLTVPAGQSGIINMPGVMKLPALYGSGSLGINATGGNPTASSGQYGDAFTSCANFTGTLNITGAVSNARMVLNFNNNSGGPYLDTLANTTVNLNTGAGAVALVATCGSTGNTASIGALNADSACGLNGSYVGGTITYQIGALNTTSDIEGNIVNGTSASAITKVGTGKLILNGSGNTYTGNTTVNAGTVVVGASGFMSASKVITVAAGATLDISAANPTFSAAQTLTGSGVVTGAVTLVSTDFLTPGTAGTAGTLSFSNNLTLSGGGVTNTFDLSSDPTGVSLPSDKIVVAGDLTLTGEHPLLLNPLNTSFGNGLYTLFTHTGNLVNEDGVVPAGTLNTNLIVSAPGTIHATYTVSNAVGQIVLIVTGVGNSLVWTGNPAGTNRWDATNTVAWTTGGNPTNFYHFDSVTFDDSITAPTNQTVNLTGTLVPASITVNTTSNYVFASSGKITGSAGITKSGSGSLTIGNSGGNDYTGVVNVNGGTLKLATVAALGATNGNTVVNGGTLDINGIQPVTEQIVVQGAGAGGTGAIVNNGTALVNQGFTGNITLAGDTAFGGTNRWDIFNGTVTGNSHNLTKVGTNYIVLNGLGDVGVSNILVQSGYFTLIGNTTLGLNTGTAILWPGSRIDLYSTTVTNTKPVSMTNATLSSSNGTNVYGGPITLNGIESFSAGTPLVLNGTLSNTGSVLKVGASILTLAGSSTYTGNTTISNGILALVGTASIANSPTLDVNAGAQLDVTGLSGSFSLSSGQTLKGIGAVKGSVTVAAGSTIAPGESAVGTLTVSNNVSLAGTNVQIVNNAGASSKLVAGGSLAYGGTLVLNNIGAAYAAGNQFTNFAAASYSGSFAAISPATPGAGLAWDTSLLTTSGILKVVATGPSGPEHLTNSVSGNTLSLSWPAGQGWILEMQTDTLQNGLGNAWVPITTAATSSTNITIDPSLPTAFYRLHAP